MTSPVSFIDPAAVRPVIPSNHCYSTTRNRRTERCWSTDPDSSSNRRQVNNVCLDPVGLHEPALWHQLPVPPDLHLIEVGDRHHPTATTPLWPNRFTRIHAVCGRLRPRALRCACVGSTSRRQPGPAPITSRRPPPSSARTPKSSSPLLLPMLGDGSYGRWVCGAVGTRVPAWDVGRGRPCRRLRQREPRPGGARDGGHGERGGVG